LIYVKSMSIKHTHTHTHTHSLPDVRRAAFKFVRHKSDFTTDFTTDIKRDVTVSAAADC
jgi:hypothetical protein